MAGPNDRFGPQAGETWMMDDDGKWVRIGDVPEDAKETLAAMGQKVADKPSVATAWIKEPEAEPAQDASIARKLLRRVRGVFQG